MVCKGIVQYKETAAEPEVTEPPSKKEARTARKTRIR